MQPHLQRIEVETVRSGDDNLTVHYTTVRQLAQKDVMKVGEIAIERTEVAALNEHVLAASKHDRSKAVPLRLEQQPLVGRGEPEPSR